MIEEQILDDRKWFVRPWTGEGCPEHPEFDLSCGACGDIGARGTADEGVIYENWRADPYRIVGQNLETVLDLGANIGSFALRALVEGAGHVYCYEPEPDNLQVFRANCDAEMFAGLISLDERAVWSASGMTVPFKVAKGGSGVDPGGTIEVPTVSLADVLGEFDSVDFLKMDMEGSEIDAFSTCPVEVLKKVKRLGMEYHWLVPDWGPMLRLLSAVFFLEIIGNPNGGHNSGGMLYGRNRFSV